MTGEGIGQALLTGRLAAESILGAGAAQPDVAAAAYERDVGHHLVADHRMSALLGRVLPTSWGARGALRVVASSGDWGRRNFARWMFEDEPRADPAHTRTVAQADVAPARRVSSRPDRRRRPGAAAVAPTRRRRRPTPRCRRCRCRRVRREPRRSRRSCPPWAGLRRCRAARSSPRRPPRRAPRPCGGRPRSSRAAWRSRGRPATARRRRARRDRRGRRPCVQATASDPHDAGATGTGAAAGAGARVRTRR